MNPGQIDPEPSSDTITGRSYPLYRSPLFRADARLEGDCQLARYQIQHGAFRWPAGGAGRNRAALPINLDSSPARQSI